MPSKKTKTTKKQRKTDTNSVVTQVNHALFWPVVILVLALWLAYRQLTAFPVWFDETIGKALFFGLPVWFYVINSGFRSVSNLFHPKKLWSGLLAGLAIGGIFGFAVVLIRLLQGGVVVDPAPIFLAENFNYEMLMGLFTSFWETLFFFGFIAGVIVEKYAKLSLVWQAVLVALIFTLFHIPNTLLRFHGSQDVMSMIFILSLFALGQFLVYYRRQNGYTLVLSQLIWGMALLVYGW